MRRDRLDEHMRVLTWAILLPVRRASPASLARRARAVPVVFFAVGAAFVAVRLGLALRVHASFGDFPDSSTYRRAAVGPVYSYVSLTGNAMRPFTVPLLYAVLPDDGTRAAAQVLVSIASWLTLAAVAALSFRDRRVRVGAFVGVLLFGSTYLATTWDFAIASESLTISLGVLCLAAWMRFVPRPNAGAAVAAVVTTTLWMFTRSQAFPLVGALAIAVGLWAWRPEARARKGAVAVTLLAVALWGASSVQNQERSYAARNGQGVGIFSETFALNLRFRILVDPAATQWFRDHGMPEPAGLTGHRRTQLAQDDWDGWGTYFEAYRNDAALTRWVDDDGQRTFVRYTVSHTPGVSRQFVTDLPDLLVPDRSSLAYVDSPAVLGPVDHLLTPYAGSAIPGFPVLWLVAACAVLASAPGRRRPSGPVLAVGAGTIVVSLAGIFLGWLGAPVEFARHALPFTLLLPIGLVVVALALLDARLVPVDAPEEQDVGTRRPPPTADPA